MEKVFSLKLILLCKSLGEIALDLSEPRNELVKQNFFHIYLRSVTIPNSTCRFTLLIKILRGGV